MSKQPALIFAFTEVPQTSLAELRELKDNVEHLFVEQSESDAYQQKLCQRITYSFHECYARAVINHSG